MKQIPLAIGVDPARTFDTFLPGSNAAAVAHLRAIAPAAAPVYLWGPPGSGKSHLLQATAERWQSQGGRAVCFDPSRSLPWRPDEGVSLMVLDDCDGLGAEQQQAAFTLFIEATARGAPVLAAGRVPPVDLALRDDLRSRLGWGHVYALVPLTDEQARAALRREADRRGIFLSDEVMDYLLTRFARDLKHLMSQLDKLDEFSLANKRLITVPLLKQMLAEEGAA
jgi:DnaA-homolog protein